MLLARRADRPIPSSTRVRTVSTSSPATTAVPDEVSRPLRPVSPPRLARERRCRVKQPTISRVHIRGSNKMLGAFQSDVFAKKSISALLGSIWRPPIPVTHTHTHTQPHDLVFFFSMVSREMTQNGHQMKKSGKAPSCKLQAGAPATGSLSRLEEKSMTDELLLVRLLDGEWETGWCIAVHCMPNAEMILTFDSLSVLTHE